MNLDLPKILQVVRGVKRVEEHCHRRLMENNNYDNIKNNKIKLF